MDEYLIVKRLMDLYCFNTYRYGYMYPGGYRSNVQNLDETVLYAHLSGEKTVCVYARERNTMFQCYDVDESDPEHVRALIDKLAAEGIPRERIYVSMSGNKGYHVEYFFDEPVWKSRIENFFDYIRRDPVIGGIKMECRPIRKLTIKIPLGVNFKTGRRCWYVDRETLEPIEDPGYVFKIERIEARKFAEIVKRCNTAAKIEDIALAKAAMAKGSGHSKRVAKKYGRGTEPTITGSGQRHEMMLKKAVWLRSIGGDEEDIYCELMNWVRRQDMTLIRSGMSEIENDARRIAVDVVRKYEVRTPTKQLVVKRGPAAIEATDMRVILAGKNRNERKVAMLVCAFCKAYGKCSLGYERIAKIIGVTYKTAYNAVQGLMEAGIIEKKKTGGIAYNHGSPVLQANEYVMATGMPVGVSCEVFGRVPIDMERVTDGFDRFYYGAIARMCGEDAIENCLTKNEKGLVDAERCHI